MSNTEAPQADQIAGATKPPGRLTNDKAPGIEVFFLEVGPELAEEMLKRNTSGQRLISRVAVDRYVSDMSTMDWIINGDTIKFSDEGELLDGQHRLTAIKTSGESQVLLIVWGLDKTAMETIDGGRKRTFSDLLRMRGIKNHTTVASTITRLWYWDKGNYGNRGTARIENPLFLNASPSSAQKFVVMEKYEQAYGITIEAAASFGMRATIKRPGITPSIYGLAWIILSGIDKDLREKYFHEVVNEAAISKMDYPIQALHNRLARIKGDFFDPTDQLDALFTVYNAWLRQTKMETVRPPRPQRWNILRMPLEYKELGA